MPHNPIEIDSPYHIVQIEMSVTCQPIIGKVDGELGIVFKIEDSCLLGMRRHAVP
jgi:hypothetical protein